MRCWECGAVPNVVVEDAPVRVVCTCGKDLGWLQPKPKVPPPPLALAKAAIAPPRSSCGPGIPDAENNRRVIEGGGYSAGIMLVAVGFLLLTGAGYYFWQADDALATMKKAEGAVIHVERRDGGRSRGVDATVQFVAADGKTYAAKLPRSSSTQVGHRISILYDPENPTINREGTFNSLYGFAWAGGGLGLIVFVLGFVSMYRQANDDAEFQEKQEMDEASFGSRFPPVCAGCAQGKPASKWRVCGPTKTVEGPAAVVHTTPFVEVPVCARCLWSMYAVYALITFIGLGVGGTLFALIIFQEGDLKTLAAGASLAGLFGGLFSAVAAQYCTRSLVSLGDLEPETDVIEFKNEAYQTLYHEHLVKMSAGQVQHAGKLEAMLGK